MAYRKWLFGFLAGAVAGVAPVLATPPCGLTDQASTSWDVTGAVVNGVAYEWNGTEFTHDGGAPLAVDWARVAAEPSPELESQAAAASNCAADAPRLTLEFQDPDTRQRVSVGLERTP